MFKLKKILIFVGIITTLVLFGCSNGSDKPTIKIGSKNFTEQFILGEIYAQVLESHGFKIERNLNLGGTLVAFEALKSGEIDLYPEYTSTAYVDIIEGEPGADNEEVYDTVKNVYKDQWNIETLEPTPFSNTYTLVTTQDIATQHDINTLSDLSNISSDLRFALIPEFGERPDGLPGLKELYDIEFKETPLFEIGLKYQALLNDEVDVTVGFNTDGQIAGNNLVTIEDDKNLWPSYHAIPHVRGEILEEHPEIEEILNKVNAVLTDEIMSSMNWQADGDEKKEASEIAEEFLKENGFIE